MKPKEICRQFDIVEDISVEEINVGHINNTYIVHTKNDRYVLQRLQRCMDVEKLEYNYNLYSSVCDEHGWIYPMWLKTNSGLFFYKDSDGFYWRMYPFIEGEILNLPLSDEQLSACGQGLAAMHSVFRNIERDPKAVFPTLHDLGYYYGEYLRITRCEKPSGRIRNAYDTEAVSTVKNIIKESEKNPAESLKRDLFLEEIIESRVCDVTREVIESRVCDVSREVIESRICDAHREITESNICDTLDIITPGISVVHGDTKLSNLIFRSGRVVGCLDMDTVMKGSLLEDIADCIRSCCICDGRFDEAAAVKLVRGYASTCGAMSEDTLLNTLPDIFNKICLELGLRYYTDSVSKEKTFIEKYPGYCRERAKIMLSLTWKK